MGSKTQIENTSEEKGESEFLETIDGLRTEKVYAALDKFFQKLRKTNRELFDEAIRMLKE